MRRSLAGVALAVTSMVALSFLIPLAFLVASQARTQSRTAAEQRAAALAPVLTLTTNTEDVRQAVASLDTGDRLAVHLPNGQVVGSAHAPAELVERAGRRSESLAQNVPGGWLYLQPVVLAQERVALVESFVPQAELTRGVGESWAVMTLTAAGLVIGSTALADRLGARVVRSSRTLSRASNALGRGELHARVEPMGPPELFEAGLAFNAMADRMTELLATERELVADLSHRLRTPLTALHLATERMGPTGEAERIATAVGQLESELHSIITAARTPLATGPMGAALRGMPDGHRPGPRGSAAYGCEAAEVIGRRAAFWGVLAQQQERPLQVVVTSEPTPVDLPEDDLAAVVDALVGNVFRHTPYGCALAIRVERAAQTLTLSVEDAGPGIADPDRALTRGASAGSTGLGLDIAHRAAAATRGRLDITRSALGGARVAVSLGLAAVPARRGRVRRAQRPAKCCLLARTSKDRATAGK